MFNTHLLTFSHHLRNAGFKLTAADVATGLETLSHIDLADRHEVSLALRTVFARSPDEQVRFQGLFKLYWDAQLVPQRERAAPPQQPQKQHERGGVSEARGEEDGSVRSSIYSPHETLQGKDALGVSASEMRELNSIVNRLARRLATRRSRRTQLSTVVSSKLAVRQMLRKNLAYGAEPLKRIFKRRTRAKTDLVFLFDVSGSMALYSRFLLQLALVLVRHPAGLRTEAFGFSTDLYRLTGALRHKEAREALASAQAAMPGRSGGTKIGLSLERFLERYPGLLGTRTLVIIASDGWDTGDLERLEAAMRSLKRRCRGVIWLNPLAGQRGFEPTAGGMKTVLPYLDALAPAHNVASLRELERHLIRLRARG